MRLLHDNISPLIASQFPAFYREEGPLFVQFVEEYYKWLESTGNPLYHSRHLLDYRDIDTTLEEFLPHFQNKYLIGTPTMGVRNQRDLVKHSHDLYQSKGTIDSLRLVFQLLFNEDVEVYYPGDDILRASDGEWVVPRYIELSISAKTASYINKDVVGNISGAKAFVERVDRRTYKGRTVDVLFITNIRPNVNTGSSFVYGEYITIDGMVAGAPKVVGSLTRIGITAAGAGFSDGQIVDVISERRGVEGKARITATGNRTGEVNYVLVDGGYGYRTTSNVIVSANVLSITSFTSSDPFTSGFPEFSTVVQPLANVSFSSPNTTFSTGDLIYGANSTNGIVATGFALVANNTSNWLLISPHSTAKLGIGTILYQDTTTGSFTIGESVYQTNTSGNSAVGVVVKANTTYVVIDQQYGPFANSETLRGGTSGAQATVTSVATRALNTTHFTDSSISKIIVGETTQGATKSAVTDLTATAKVVGSNTSAIGVFQATGAFRGGYRALVYSSNNGATAEITVTSSGGLPGGFKIGAVRDTEVVALNTDVIGGVNTANVSYLDVPIDDASYYFPANNSVGYTDVIGTALAKSSYTIGTIFSLTERYPGFNNTAKPFVVEIEPLVAAYGKRSRIACSVSGIVGGFKSDEIVTQDVPLPRVTLSVNTVVGTFNPSARELIQQTRASDSQTIYGELYVVNVTGGSGTLAVLSTETFESGSPIIGLKSGATASVSAVSTGTVVSTARGKVLTANTTSVVLNRTSFQDFIVGESLFGTESGATATVITIQEDSGSGVLGNNAFVDPLAGIADGTIAAVEIIDSGLFYENGETVTLEVANNQSTASGVAYVETNGVMEGFWRGSRGTLDQNVKIQDNEYYQEYSYEIQSGIDRTVYESAVNSITHVAGTKMFSRYLKNTYGQSLLNAATAAYSSIATLTLSSHTGSFVVGETISQSNGSAITATGTVLSFNDTLNTLEVVRTTGAFITSNTVTGNTSLATGSTSSINITIM